MKISLITKKIAALALAVIFTALSLCGCVRYKHIVVESRWVDDFCFSIYEDGTVEITAYRGEEENLKLPNLLGDFEMIGFGTKTFDGCETIKQVLIPPTVKSLPPKLFNNCPNLETIYIPQSVKTIGQNVIFNCPNFKTVLFPGTEAEWNAINVGATPWTDNYVLVNAEILFGYQLN